MDVRDFDLDYWSLADAYLTRHEAGASPAGEYWQRRAELLEEFLGVALDPRRVPRSWDGRCKGLRTSAPVDGSIHALAEWDSRETSSGMAAATVCGIALEAVRLHAVISSPLYTGQLEGLPHPFVRGLQDHHHRTFLALDDGLRAACRALVADIIRTLDPSVAERRVRMTKLFERGLEWWPPEDDNF